MSSFTDIDLVLLPWAAARRLHVFTHDRDDEVRTFDMSSADGRHRCQLWLEPRPSGSVTVHLWDYSARHAAYPASVTDLQNALDRAYSTAREWLGYPR